MKAIRFTLTSQVEYLAKHSEVARVAAGRRPTIFKSKRDYDRKRDAYIARRDNAKRAREGGW